MRVRTLLSLVATMVPLSVASCGEDDSTETVPVVDASVDTSEAAAPDGGSAGAAGSSPEASVPDSAEQDAGGDAVVDAAEEAALEAGPEAGMPLELSFQHATGYGVAGWNADGTGKEAQKTGYDILQPYAACMPSGTAVALAYVASADYDGIVGGCPGGVQGSPSVPPIGFASFVSVLGSEGKSMTDLAIRFTPVVLDSPSSFPGNPELRVYKGADYVLYLSGEPMVRAKGDVVEMTVDYKDGADCNDDVIEATASDLVVTDESASSGTAVKAAAAAFLADVAGRKVRLHLIGFQALAPFSGTVAGRTGATFSVGGGGKLGLAP